MGYEKEKIKIEKNDIWKLFIERVRNNLHIILSMSPIGNSLKIWCRKFPAIVNCCTIDWYDSWSGDALQSVANRLLAYKKFDNLNTITHFIKIFHKNSIDISTKFTQEMNRKYF